MKPSLHNSYNTLYSIVVLYESQTPGGYMKIGNALRAKLGNEVAKRTEQKMANTSYLVHTDVCPDCTKPTLAITWFNNGQIVARCKCGFREQDQYSRKAG